MGLPKKSPTWNPAEINETEPRADLVEFIPTGSQAKKIYCRGFGNNQAYALDLPVRADPCCQFGTARADLRPIYHHHQEQNQARFHRRPRAAERRRGRPGLPLGWWKSAHRAAFYTGLGALTGVGLAERR